MTTPSIKLLVGIILSVVAAIPSSHAGEPDSISDRNLSRRFPADQVVSVSPENRSFTIKLDTLVESIQDSIGRCNIEIIDPNQKRHRLTVNEDGIATVQDAEEGLYVVVAANDVAYGTIVIACREIADAPEQENADDMFRLDFEDSDPNETVVLMVIPVREQEIRPVVKNNLPKFPLIMPSVIDRALIADQLTTPGAENMIQLGNGGALRGKLTSLVKATSRYSGVEGTLIVVYKNGKPVGKTTANGLGHFQINGLKPGVHGLVIAGRGGFAVFGIEVIDSEGLVDRPLHGRGFSYAQLMNDGEILPVVLAPPTVFSIVTDSVASIYDDVRLQAEETDTMLAQKSRLDEEDRQALESILSVYAREQKAIDAALPSPKRSRILSDSEAQASVSQPNSDAMEVQRFDRKDIPVNSLRLSNNDGSTAPFNPLRAN